MKKMRFSLLEALLVSSIGVTFSPNPVLAQSDTIKNPFDSISYWYEPLDKSSIKSGLLINQGALLVNPKPYSEPGYNPPSINQADWFKFYSAIFHSQINNSLSLPHPFDIEDRVQFDEFNGTLTLRQ